MSRWAILDMGTNTFLLLIAEWEAVHRRLRVLQDVHAVPRIGASICYSKEIMTSSLERAISIALIYNKLCIRHTVRKLWAVGTAPFRCAQNAVGVAREILSRFTCPHLLTILTPQQEALYSYRGALFSEAVNVKKRYMVIDVGGGSTEIIYGIGWDPLFVSSLPVGAVWLWEHASRQRWSLKEAALYVRETILEYLRLSPPHYPTQVYAIAGTPITLAMIYQGIEYTQWWRAHGIEMSRNQLEEMTSSLWHSSLDERRASVSIHPARADIIPAGALLLVQLMHLLGISSLKVSIYGLRYGVLLELLAREEQFDLYSPFSLDDPRIMK